MVPWLASEPVPTSEYIDWLIYRARTEFASEDMRDRIRDSLYKGINDIPHPGHVDHQEVHGMVVHGLVDELKGILSQRPTINIGETSFSTLAVQRAEPVQIAMNALFPALERDLSQLTQMRILEDQVRFGRAYDALEYVPLRWAKYPTGKFRNPDGTISPASLDRYQTQRRKFMLGNRLPMLWRHLPARGCFAFKDDWGISEFLSIEERRAADIARSYNMPELIQDMEQFTQNPSMHVLFCRYYNRRYMAYWVSRGYASQTWEQRAQAGLSLLTLAQTHGDVVYAAEHPYGMVPVTETLSLDSTDQNPAWLHQSPIDAVIPLALYLDQLLAQQGTAIRMWCYPTPYLKTLKAELGAAFQDVPIGPEGRPEPINLIPGNVHFLQAGQDFGWLVAPANGLNADKQIAIIEGLIGRLSIPSQLFDGSSQANGYLYNSMTQAVTAKLQPLIDNTKMAHARRVELAFRILEVHGDDLLIKQQGQDPSELGSWATIRYKDVENWDSRYIMTVNYEDQHPYDEAQDVQALLALTSDRGNGAGPVLSDETAMAHYLPWVDVQKELKKRRLQKFTNSPPVDQFLTNEVVQDAHLQIQQEQTNPPSLTPEQAGALPPALLQASQAAGSPLQPTPLPPAAPPTASAGVTGAPGSPGLPMIPGLTAPATPAGPRFPSGTAPAKKGRKPAGPAPTSGMGAGGRARGQAKSPPKKPGQP